jgi:PPIC-type PPIASE domain
MFGSLKLRIIQVIALSLMAFMVYVWYSAPKVMNQHPEAYKKSLVVNQQTLIAYLKFNTKDATEAEVIDKFNKMTAEQRKKLMKAFIRDQVLYAEAKAFNLQVDDYVVKHELAKKFESIVKDLIVENIEITESQLMSHYEANKKKYKLDPIITFTHVYFNKKQHGDLESELLAKEMMHNLNSKRARFYEAIQEGDRFKHNRNYVEHIPEYVSAHFGNKMAKALFTSNPKDRRWKGPFESETGFHVVKVIKLKPARPAPYPAIRDKVYKDVQAMFIQMAADNIIQELINSYDVEIIEND